MPILKRKRWSDAWRSFTANSGGAEGRHTESVDVVPRKTVNQCYLTEPEGCRAPYAASIRAFRSALEAFRKWDNKEDKVRC